MNETKETTNNKIRKKLVSIAAGISSVESVTESTNSTTRITGEVIEAIEELQEKSRSIVDIVHAINEIAEQTTLLSLNASIEAARASQIENIIDEILEKTSQVVDISKEAFDIVQEQKASVADTTEAFDEMKKNISTLLISLDEIAHNVVTTEGSRDITLGSVESISAVSAETALSDKSALLTELLSKFTV